MAKRKYTLKEIKEAIEENCLIEPVMIDEISAKKLLIQNLLFCGRLLIMH